MPAYASQATNEFYFQQSNVTAQNLSKRVLDTPLFLEYVIMYCKLTTQKYTNVTVLLIKHSQKSQQQYQLESLCVIVAESQVSENSLGCNVLSVVDRSVNSESVCHHSAQPLNCKPTERNPIAVERSLYDVLLPVPCSLVMSHSDK